MQSINFLKDLELEINVKQEYKTYPSENRISFRQKDIMGTFSIEIGEFVDGILAVIIDLVDKDGTSNFFQFSNDIFHRLVLFLKKHVTTPHVIIGTVSLKDSWKKMLDEHDFTSFNEDEIGLVQIEDYENIQWVYRSGEEIFPVLLTNLNNVLIEFNDFIKNKKCKKKNSTGKSFDVYFNPFQQYVLSCGYRLIFSCSRLNPMILKLSVENTEYEFETTYLDKPVQRLFEEFHESMRLKWLVDETLFPSSYSLSSVHCRGVIREEACILQQKALDAGWEYDEIDTIFSLLTSDEFCDFLDSYQFFYGNPETRQLGNSLVIIKKLQNMYSISIFAGDVQYILNAKNGFPFIANELEFRKENLEK